MLPSYRPAPDYETAMQHKYQTNAHEPLRTGHAFLYSSQPEIRQSESYASAHLPYPDVTVNNKMEHNVAYSSYDRNITDLGENMRLLNLYKQPPPYPSYRINSNSTPDLAVSSQRCKPQPHSFLNHPVSGSSPDLVSNAAIFNRHFIKPYGHIVYRPQTSYLTAQHGTYENLASIFDQSVRPQAVIVNNPDITKHIQKIYDKHGGVIYCLPANMKQYIGENPTGFVLARNPGPIIAHHADDSSQEPIYENIPLPWQNDNSVGQVQVDQSEVCSRIQSINSAPDINHVVVNQTLVNAFLQTQAHAQLEAHAQNSGAGSRENLYANIEAEAHERASRESGSGRYRKSNSSPTATELSQTETLDRNNTFIVNKSVQNSPSGSFRHEESMSAVSDGVGDAVTDCSTATASSTASSGKGKKKRWGILGARSKSSEKVKSATLGREKVKEKKPLNNRHRWSTGLPHLQPLPMSISKETMVSCFYFSFVFIFK